MAAAVGRLSLKVKLARQLSTTAARPFSKLVKVKGVGGSPVRRAPVPWLGAAFSARSLRLSRPQPPIQVYGLEGRYATALYSAASKQKKLDQVEKELSRVWVRCFPPPPPPKACLCPSGRGGGSSGAGPPPLLSREVGSALGSCGGPTAGWAGVCAACPAHPGMKLLGRDAGGGSALKEAYCK